MNKYRNTLIFAAAVAAPVAAKVVVYYALTRTADRHLKLIRNEKFPVVGQQYRDLHNSFLQDPKVKESMTLLDQYDPDQN